MLRRFSLSRRPAHRPAQIPPGLRIYAIGDVHGRADLLRQMHERISEDARSSPAVEKRIIHLGDYIDRGSASRDVLEMLMTPRSDGIQTTHLLGNHEAMLLQFLDDTGIGPEWLAYGGLATLMSYGVQPKRDGSVEQKLAVAQQELREKLPPSHRQFLAALPTHQSFGDYFFVHAGVRPGVPLDQQSDADLIWIREEFLQSADFHGKIVVHGHSYKTEPEILHNRIGIDTGAYATGRLTCLVLEGTDYRFL
jgi:serine/threonine protein phosphatase 1